MMMFYGAMVVLVVVQGGVFAQDLGAVTPRIYQLVEDIQSILDTLAVYDPTAISPKCRTDLQMFADGINKTVKEWAWYMADAWGAPQSGLLQGDGVWEGSYDQCQRVSSKKPEGEMHGALCMTTWYNDGLYSTSGIGTCLPRSCNATEVSALLITGSLTSKLALPGAFPKTDYSKITSYCARAPGDPDFSHDPSAIVALVILSLFGLLVLIATAYDVITTMRSKMETARTNQSATGEMGSKRTLTGAEETGSGNAHAAEDGKDDVRPPAENGPTVSVQQASSDPKPERRPNKGEQLLLAFSLYRHVPAMLSFDHSRGSFQCLNGIRFLAFAWIVLGHTFQIGIDFKVTQTTANMLYKDELGKSISGRVISNMYVAVEAFFVLSAFLTTVSFLKKMKPGQKPQCRMMSLYYFHRYWRLTPVYGLILMTYACLFKHMGAGPFYAPSIPDAENCKTYFWKNLLYLNNFNFEGKECMGWSWYLANDFQFYVVSPLFLLALFYKPVLGIVLTVLAMCGSILIRFVLYTLLYTGAVEEGFFWGFIYFPPWTRASTYFMGMLLGYFMWKRDFKPVKIKLWVVMVLWVLVWPFACGMVLIFPAEAAWSQILYNSLLSPVSGVVVVWLIFVCLNGYGGIFNIILSWNGWLPLARLTYVGYLIHPIVIYYSYYNNKVQLYMTDWTMMYMFFGHLLLTLGISFVISACLEVPFGALEKVIFPPRKPSPDAPKVNGPAAQSSSDL